MGYKYRNDGQTPGHVDSSKSNSIPTPTLAPRDNTIVAGKPGKILSSPNLNQLNNKLGLNLGGEAVMDMTDKGSEINEDTPNVKVLSKKK